jgi:predicted dinucleotide-binding enzyme
MLIARLAIVGGTGPQGRGLALRFRGGRPRGRRRLARAGEAEGVVDAMRAAHPGLDVRGDENGAAIAGADAVVLALAPKVSPRRSTRSATGSRVGS